MIAGAHKRSPGAWGQVVFLLWTLLMIALLPAGRLPWLLGIVLAYALATGSPIWDVLRSRRLWILIIGVVALSAFLIGERDMALWKLRLSSEGLWAGVWMATRALCLTLAFAATIGALSVSQLSGLFERLGLKGLGFALGVALNLMAVLSEVVAAAYHTCRLRGGFRRRVLANARLTLVAAITSALRYGDDVVLAAAARGFDPERTSSPAAPLRRADLALAGLLAGASLCMAVL